MSGPVSRAASGRQTEVRSFFAAWLDAEQLARWRRFAARVPWADYQQDPDWAEVERYGSGRRTRQPFYFWSERNGKLCLTAIGIRRRLPVPGRVFWEFDKGPTCIEPGVLDEWLPWLIGSLGREVARLRVEPAAPLDKGGDDMETVLERHGFARRRAEGTWATLLIGITGSEEKILASLRSQTRRKITKSRELGIEVHPEDTPDGWSTLCRLQSEVSARAPVRPLDPATLTRMSRHWLRGGSGGTVLVARRGGEPLSGMLLIVHRGTAHMRVLAVSQRVATVPMSHLLLWEAMLWAKGQGCHSFDLDGYDTMARPGDQLWGVNGFKRSFAPNQELTKVVAIHERVSSPLLVASASRLRRLEAWSRMRAGGPTP